MLLYFLLALFLLVGILRPKPIGYYDLLEAGS